MDITPHLKKSCLIIWMVFSSGMLLAQQVPSPRNLFIPKGGITEKTAALLWDKPSQYQDIKAYQIFKDGKYTATATKTNYTVMSLTAGKPYSFSIKAQSKDGRLSAACKAVMVMTKPAGKIFNILNYGAKGDGVTKNTRAIQQAIDKCTKGGTVYIPKGIFLSGPIFLKSNMTLLIAKGGTLKGSTDVKDYYPLILNRFEGWEMKTLASLVNAGHLDRSGKYNVVNLSIRGEGTISGGGSMLGDAMVAALGLRGRGRLICIMNGQNIDIQGLNIENPPCWTIHYIYSNQVTLHDLNIVSTAHNGDGIDPDSSTDSYIFNCSFSTGDDCIAIKSGKNPEGNIVAKPTRNVRITDCDFIKGHSLAIGSEMSGGVSDVFIQDCKIGPLMRGLQIKGTKDRGGYVTRVTVKDCTLLQINIITAVNYNNDGAPAPVLPWFSDMEFSNLNMSEASAGQVLLDINGFPDPAHYTKNIAFNNIRLPEHTIVNIKNADGLKFSQVQCTDGAKPEYRVIESKNIVN